MKLKRISKNRVDFLRDRALISMTLFSFSVNSITLISCTILFGIIFPNFLVLQLTMDRQTSIFLCATGLLS